ncbi:MFS family permease [Streptomyces sp. TE33382]
MLCAVSMLQFFIAVDVTVVNIALPSIGADFNVDGHALTWVVVGYTVTGGGLLMLGTGPVRRRVAAGGPAATFALLVVARLLQGVGEAIAMPAAMATIVLMFPEGPRRSWALSVWAAVASCGLVLGFVLSGIITAHLGWRWVFLVSVPFILVVLAAAVFLVEGDRPVAKDAPPLDLHGELLLTACPLLFIFGVVEAGEPGTPAWVVPGALAGAVAAGAGFVRVEACSRNPLLPLRFFANRRRVAANLATMLLSGALSTAFLLFTFYLQDRLGIEPLGAGLTMLPLALADRVLPARASSAGPLGSTRVCARRHRVHRGRDGVRYRGAAICRSQRRHRGRRRDRLGHSACGRPVGRCDRCSSLRRDRVRPVLALLRSIPGGRPAGRHGARDRCGCGLAHARTRNGPAGTGRATFAPQGCTAMTVGAAHSCGMARISPQRDFSISARVRSSKTSVGVSPLCSWNQARASAVMSSRRPASWERAAMYPSSTRNSWTYSKPSCL